MNRFKRLAVVVVLLASTPFAFGAEPDLAGPLAKIKAVKQEGAGNAEARTAWKLVAAAGVDGLMPTLAAMDDANTVASNWLRLAAQAIVEKEQQAKRPLPNAKLEAFVKDVSRAPLSRRLAYEFLAMADPTAPTRLLPGMVNDPSVEIRHDALAAELAKIEPADLKTEAGQAALRKLFASSRDKDQAEKIAKLLKENTIDVDLNKHFGVVSEYMLIGPFDSAMGAGYARPYDPETKVDLKAKLTGKDGEEVAWIHHASAEPYGVVDLNAALGKHKDAVAYVYTVIEAGKEMPVELRFGCITAYRVYLNGKELACREEYHHGQRFDQYTATGTLKQGKNEILVKVCQNNQTENWAQDWKFQLRLCDFTGGALPVQVSLPK
jgi:hypothetical protein